MRVLVVKTDRNLSANRIAKEIERMHREASEYGIMFMPEGFSGKVVEFDAVREEAIDLGPFGIVKGATND